MNRKEEAAKLINKKLKGETFLSYEEIAEDTVNRIRQLLLIIVVPVYKRIQVF